MDAVTAPPTPENCQAKRSLRILVVEDHEDTITYLCRHLESSGHSVRVARNVDEALRTLRQSPSDLLLCDILLPGRDGWDLMNDLGDVRPRCCVAMSVRGQNEDLDRSRRTGFDHHLTKPFLPEDLDALLERF